MAAPKRATLLPAIRGCGREEPIDDDRESARSLESVGKIAVLGAMVEQRKRTSSLPPPPPSPDESGMRRALGAYRREEKKSLGFIKIR